jgi:putative ABC transport system permease protein
MTTGRLLRQSGRTLARYKLRSALMMLGSLVGVAALTVVVSVGESAQRKMLTTARQIFGAPSIVVMAGGTHLLGGPRAGAARLTLDDIQAVADEVPEIELWDAQQILPGASVKRGDLATTARVVGQSERSARVWNRSVSSGEYFDELAVRTSARVALIGETVARHLFGSDDPIGAEILVESVSVRVIGVLERFGTDLHGMDRDNEVVLPISTMMRRVMNVDTILASKLLVRQPDRPDVVADAVRHALRSRHGIATGQPDDFAIMTTVEVQQMVALMERALNLYLPLVAGIAIVVGGVVAAALMLASVNERRGEIGLRRAVGARPGDISLQFVIETALIVAGGGVCGMAVGVAGAHIAASHLRLGSGFSVRALLLGLTLSVITGVLAGVLPARRAARLQPADALR